MAAMPKRRRAPKKRQTQHSKFIEAAREIGADASEAAFKKALGKIAPKPKKDGADRLR